MKDIVIIGTGGLAKEIAYLIEEINIINPTYNILGFISEKEEDVGKTHGNYRIYNHDDWLHSYKRKINVAIAIGDPFIISKIRTKLKNNYSIEYPNIIHPNVIGDFKNIKIGEGNVITAGNIFTTDITIGSFNIFNLNGTIGHDTVIGDCNVFNPTTNISGNVTIGNNVLVGTGAQILQNIKICNNAILGAGSVLTKDIVEEGIYVGIPARKKD